MDMTATFVAFSYNTDRKGEVVNRAEQEAVMWNRIKSRYGRDPVAIHRGPISLPNGQVVVKATEVYIQI